MKRYHFSFYLVLLIDIITYALVFNIANLAGQIILAVVIIFHFYKLYITRIINHDPWYVNDENTKKQNYIIFMGMIFFVIAKYMILFYIFS